MSPFQNPEIEASNDNTLLLSECQGEGIVVFSHPRIVISEFSLEYLFHSLLNIYAKYLTKGYCYERIFAWECCDCKRYP